MICRLPGRSGVASSLAMLAVAAFVVATPAAQNVADPPSTAGGAPAPTPQPPQSQGVERQTPAFRTGVELVSLNVTVTDATSHYVTTLEQDDFSVFEDGAKQDVTFFNRTNLPIALALMLDTSASMDTKLATAQEAAIGFARRLRPQDLAEVIDFDSRVTILAPFSSEAGELEQAIRRTSAGGSTSLYNAIYVALKDLKKLTAKNVEEIRRRAIIVLSDGEDTSSLLPFEEVLDLAKRSETVIYSIGLRSKEGSTESKGFKEADIRPAAAVAGNGRTRVFPESGGRPGQDLRPDLGRAFEPVYGGLHVKKCPPRRRVAANCGSSQRNPADSAYEAGVLRPDIALI